MFPIDGETIENETFPPLVISWCRHTHTRKVMIGLMGNANEITTGGCVCVCVQIPSKSIHHVKNMRISITTWA